MLKKEILKKIMQHYGFQKKRDFANFLGIPPTTLASWELRNSFNYELLYDKCTDISAEFLITGKNMLRNESLKDQNKLIIKEVIFKLSSIVK